MEFRPRELESLKSVAESILSDTCDIYSVSEAIDSVGSRTQSRVLRSADVPCSIESVEPPNQEVLKDGVMSVVASVLAYFKADQPINSTDQILLSDGHFYDVVEVSGPETIRIYTEVLLVRTGAPA